MEEGTLFQVVDRIDRRRFFAMTGRLLFLLSL